MKMLESEQRGTSNHPKKSRPRPPFAERAQSFPGLDAKMKNQADHGERSYEGHGRLKGKTALITGGDSGIGRAVAIAFAREGATVAISYLKSEETDAQETRRWIEGAGRQAITLPGDIQDESHCRELIQRALSETKRLDILVNNAAYQMSYDGLEEINEQELDRTFRTNIYAMFYLCKAAVPRMKPGSTIINTASIQAYQPSPNLLAYAATKAAIVNFTKGLSKMVLEKGIRVNAVAPGPVWTPLIPSTVSKKKTREFGANTAFERPAQPSELAPLFVFLASEESTYVSGEVFGATGNRMPV